MIILKVSSLVVGFIFGILLCNLMWEDAEMKYSPSKNKIVSYYVISGLFMGCAFICASHYVDIFLYIESLAILGGLVFLAVYAIQDMLQMAVYAFLLNVGSIGIVMLRIMVYVCEGEFVEMFSFLVLSGAVYVGLKIIARIFPNSIGCGDYDILFVIYALCGNQGMVQVLFASSCIGLLIYVPMLLLKRVKKSEKIPLAPILYLGTLAYLWL